MHARRTNEINMYKNLCTADDVLANLSSQELLLFTQSIDLPVAILARPTIVKETAFKKSLDVTEIGALNNR